MLVVLVWVRLENVFEGLLFPNFCLECLSKDLLKYMRSYLLLLSSPSPLSSQVLTTGKFLKEWCAFNKPNIKFVEQIVTERQAELEKGIRTDEKDVLTLMLTAADPQTGQKLPPDNVRDQILTFLLAGHDSVSRALSS